MRAARCRQYGTPSSVSVEEVEDPRPGPGEVVVDVAAAAVNFPDVLLVADQYQIHVACRSRPGSEFSGTVCALGPGVEGWTEGDRVLGATLVGAFAEQVVVPVGSLERMDAGADLLVAAASGVAHRTAYHALRSVARVEPRGVGRGPRGGRWGRPGRGRDRGGPRGLGAGRRLDPGAPRPLPPEGGERGRLLRPPRT